MLLLYKYYRFSRLLYRCYYYINVIDLVGCYIDGNNYEGPSYTFTQYSINSSSDVNECGDVCRENGYSYAAYSTFGKF